MSVLSCGRKRYVLQNKNKLWIRQQEGYHHLLGDKNTGALRGILLFIPIMSHHFTLFPVSICWSETTLPNGWITLLGHTRSTYQQHFQSNKNLHGSLFKHYFMLSDDLIVCLNSLFLFVRLLPGRGKKKDVILIA